MHAFNFGATLLLADLLITVCLATTNYGSNACMHASTLFIKSGAKLPITLIFISSNSRRFSSSVVPFRIERV